MWLGDHPKDPSKSIMVIDTEGKYIFQFLQKVVWFQLISKLGLNHAKGSSSVDMWIFILSILLSTVFVYNIKQVIDANSVKGLKLAVNLARHVKAKSAATPSNSSSTNSATTKNDPLIISQKKNSNRNKLGSKKSSKISGLMAQFETPQQSRVEQLVKTFEPNFGQNQKRKTTSTSSPSKIEKEIGSAKLISKAVNYLDLNNKTSYFLFRVLLILICYSYL